MDRLLATNTVPLSSADKAPSTGTPQYATSGNPATGVPATQLPAYQYNALQEELMAIITAAGITPERNTWNQVLTALEQLFVPAGSSRIKLTANTTFYVATTGNDTTGNGSNSAPWFSIQKAINYVENNIDLAGYSVTISVANGTYASFVASGPLVGAATNSSVTALVIQGNTASPTSCVISTTATGQNCALASFGAAFSIGGFSFSASGLGASGLAAIQGGKILVSGAMNYGACNSSQILSHDAGSYIDIASNYTISGGASYHFSSGFGAQIINPSGGLAVTLTGTPNYTGAFAECDTCASLTMVGVTYTGTATGQKYYAALNGVISTSGGGANYFPGNVAGSATTGAQYV
jgi:hypothetical protein